MKHININIDREAVRNVVGAVCGVAVGVAYFVLGCAAVVYKENIPVGYDDAIEVIVNSDMFSSCKVEAINAVKRDEESGYYKTIINIVKSNMFSSSKVDAIKKLG